MSKNTVDIIHMGFSWCIHGLANYNDRIGNIQTKVTDRSIFQLSMGTSLYEPVHLFDLHLVYDFVLLECHRSYNPAFLFLQRDINMLYLDLATSIPTKYFKYAFNLFTSRSSHVTTIRHQHIQ
jgi:hypothetical protein